MGEMIEFRSNSNHASGYLATPRSGSGPGVLVIQEWWGLVPHIKDVADRVAAVGFVALAPDLYDGATTSEPDEAGKMMMAMELDKAARHMSGAVDHLLSLDATTGDGVGVVGFCMGGGLALWLPTMNPAVTAAVPFYGALPWEDVNPDYSRSNAAFLGHYAEKDSWATLESARELEKAIREAGNEVTFHYYPGCDHAFFNDTRDEVHDAEASMLAWNRTVSFLERTLAG